MSWPLISHEKFTWEKFICRNGYATHQFLDPSTNKLIDCEPIGYCEAKKLRVRPRDEGFAFLVLNTETQEEIWFHNHVMINL
jgi:hypothetical protein